MSAQDKFKAALRDLNNAAYAAIRASVDTVQLPDVDRQTLREIARKTDWLVDSDGVRAE